MTVFHQDTLVSSGSISPSTSMMLREVCNDALLTGIHLRKWIKFVWSEEESSKVVIPNV